MCEFSGQKGFHGKLVVLHLFYVIHWDIPYIRAHCSRGNFELRLGLLGARLKGIGVKACLRLHFELLLGVSALKEGLVVSRGLRL